MIRNLWKLILGHLNFNNLGSMRKTDMVNDLPYLKVDGEICERCILGKKHGESFSNKN